MSQPAGQAAARDGGADRAHQQAEVKDGERPVGEAALGSPLLRAQAPRNSLTPAALVAVQRHAGNRAAAALARRGLRPPDGRVSEGGPARNEVRVQAYLEGLAARDPALAGLVAQLESGFDLLRQAAGGLSESRRRYVQRVDAAYRAMERQDFAPTAIMRWARAVFAAAQQLSLGDDWTSGSRREELQGHARRVLPLTSQILNHGSVEDVVRDDLDDRERARAQEQRRQLTREVAQYLRTRWASIREAPHLHATAVRGRLRRVLGTEEAVRAFIADPPGAHPDLARFLRLWMRNPRAIERGHYDRLRAAVLAVGGEWADIVMPADARSHAERAEEAGVELTQSERDRLEAAELTGDDAETGLEAEVTGTVADTAITMIPILDQLGDVRDFSAHVYALLDVDGRHPDEHESWLRWVGVSLTGIGVVPEIGSFLRGTGRTAMAVIRTAGDAIAPIVRRITGPVADLLRRAGGIPIVQRLLREVGEGWDALAGIARRGWDSVASRVDELLAGPIAGLSETVRQARRRWHEVKTAGRRMIPQALAQLRALFGRVFDAVLSALRRGADTVLPRSVLEAGGAALERAAAAASRARDLVDNVVDQVGGATRRLELADEALARVDDLQERLDDARRALSEARDAGDATRLEDLTRQVEDLTDDLDEAAADAERRLSRGAGADVEESATTRTRRRRPSRRGRDRGGAGSRTPTAAPEPEGTVPVAPGRQPDATSAPVGTRLDADTLEQEFGIPRENQQHFDDIAEEFDVEIDVRPTNPEAPRLLRLGHMPKPEYIKSKSIQPLDVHLGARQEDVGLVGYFRPAAELERPHGMDDADWSALQDRWRQRVEEYERHHHTMEQLQLPPSAREPTYRQGIYADAPQLTVDEHGVIRIVGGTTPRGRAQGFTGDHDVFDIRHSDGRPPTEEEYLEIVAAMRERGMAVEHGAHMRWWAGHRGEAGGAFGGIRRGHREGGEALIRFTPGGHPTTAYAHPRPIDREGLVGRRRATRLGSRQATRERRRREREASASE